MQKSKKKARQRATLSLRIQSPLRCLTSVFGMGTGVSTVPSSPDFFLKDNLSKLDMDLFYYNFLTNTIQILGLLVSVSLMSHNTYTPDLSTS